MRTAAGLDTNVGCSVGLHGSSSDATTNFTFLFHVNIALAVTVNYLTGKTQRGPKVMDVCWW